VDDAEAGRLAAEHRLAAPGLMVRSTRLRKAWWMLIQATPPIRKVSAKPRLRV
jgi:hypothetical protein